MKIHIFFSNPKFEYLSKNHNFNRLACTSDLNPELESIDEISELKSYNDSYFSFIETLHLLDKFQYYGLDETNFKNLLNSISAQLFDLNTYQIGSIRKDLHRYYRFPQSTIVLSTLFDHILHQINISEVIMSNTSQFWLSSIFYYSKVRIISEKSLNLLDSLIQKYYIKYNFIITEVPYSISTMFGIKKVQLERPKNEIYDIIHRCKSKRIYFNDVFVIQKKENKTYSYSQLISVSLNTKTSIPLISHCVPIFISNITKKFDNIDFIILNNHNIWISEDSIHIASETIFDFNSNSSHNFFTDKSNLVVSSITTINEVKIETKNLVISDVSLDPNKSKTNEIHSLENHKLIINRNNSGVYIRTDDIENILIDSNNPSTSQIKFKYYENQIFKISIPSILMLKSHVVYRRYVDIDMLLKNKYNDTTTLIDFKYQGQTVILFFYKYTDEILAKYPIITDLNEARKYLIKHGCTGWIPADIWIELRDEKLPSIIKFICSNEMKYEISYFIYNYANCFDLMRTLYVSSFLFEDDINEFLILLLSSIESIPKTSILHLQSTLIDSIMSVPTSYPLFSPIYPEFFVHKKHDILYLITNSYLSDSMFSYLSREIFKNILYNRAHYSHLSYLYVTEDNMIDHVRTSELNNRLITAKKKIFEYSFKHSYFDVINQCVMLISNILIRKIDTKIDLYLCESKIFYVNWNFDDLYFELNGLVKVHYIKFN